MSLPSINFLHLTVSEIQLRQTFSRRPPAHQDTTGENTPTVLKGCGVKTSQYQDVKKAFVILLLAECALLRDSCFKVKSLKTQYFIVSKFLR